MGKEADPVALYYRLQDHYGPQQWWPAETPFEVMVGAILTQNAAWERVEVAIASLKQHRLMSAAAICSIGQDELAEVIRSCGYFNLKAKRLQAFCGWYNGREQALSALETVPLREALLAVHGVGPETADDMLLYAFQRPVFVIDTYTRRLFERLGWYPQKSPYQQLQQFVEGAFSSWKEAERIVIFNELHGLIVAHAKAFCKKQPRCMGCPLQCGYEPEKK